MCEHLTYQYHKTLYKLFTLFIWVHILWLISNLLVHKKGFIHFDCDVKLKYVTRGEIIQIVGIYKAGINASENTNLW